MPSISIADPMVRMGHPSDGMTLMLAIRKHGPTRPVTIRCHSRRCICDNVARLPDGVIRGAHDYKRSNCSRKTLPLIRLT